MNTSLRIVAPALFAILLVIACGDFAPPGRTPRNPNDVVGDGGSQGFDGGFNGVLTPDNACSAINGRKCDYLQRCGLIAPGATALRDCASILVTTECGPSLWPSRVAVGTLRFSSIIAEACASSYELRGCDSYQSPPQICTEFVTPGSALNGACYGGQWQECGEGVCRGLSCPKSCRAPGANGEDCSVDEDCATDAGLYCLPSGTFSSGACSPFAGLDAGCNALVRCAYGMFCGVDGRCEALRVNGESCLEGTCARGSWCASSPDGGLCTAKYLPNASCTDDRQCQEGSICVTESGRCASKGPLPSGSPCGSRQLCATGLACVGLSAQSLGSCAAPLQADAPCLGSWDCSPELSCLAADASTDLRCQSRHPDGQPCAQDRDCLVFSACRSGSCYRLPRLFEECPNQSCIYGSCTALSDGGSVCSGLLPPNAKCQVDEECSSNRCVAGSCLAACTP